MNSNQQQQQQQQQRDPNPSTAATLFATTTTTSTPSTSLSSSSSAFLDHMMMSSQQPPPPPWPVHASHQQTPQLHPHHHHTSTMSLTPTTGSGVSLGDVLFASGPNDATQRQRPTSPSRQLLQSSTNDLFGSPMVSRDSGLFASARLTSDLAMSAAEIMPKRRGDANGDEGGDDDDDEGSRHAHALQLMHHMESHVKKVSDRLRNGDDVGDDVGDDDVGDGHTVVRARVRDDHADADDADARVDESIPTPSSSSSTTTTTTITASASAVKPTTSQRFTASVAPHAHVPSAGDVLDAALRPRVVAYEDTHNVGDRRGALLTPVPVTVATRPSLVSPFSPAKQPPPHAPQAHQQQAHHQPLNATTTSSSAAACPTMPLQSPFTLGTRKDHVAASLASLWDLSRNPGGFAAYLGDGERCWLGRMLVGLDVSTAALQAWTAVQPDATHAASALSFFKPVPTKPTAATAPTTTATTTTATTAHTTTTTDAAAASPTSSASPSSTTPASTPLPEVAIGDDVHLQLCTFRGQYGVCAVHGASGTPVGVLPWAIGRWLSQLLHHPRLRLHAERCALPGGVAPQQVSRTTTLEQASLDGSVSRITVTIPTSTFVSASIRSANVVASGSGSESGSGSGSGSGSQVKAVLEDQTATTTPSAATTTTTTTTSTSTTQSHTSPITAAQAPPCVYPFVVDITLHLMTPNGDDRIEPATQAERAAWLQMSRHLHRPMRIAHGTAVRESSSSSSRHPVVPPCAGDVGSVEDDVGSAESTESSASTLGQRSLDAFRRLASLSLPALTTSGTAAASLFSSLSQQQQQRLYHGHQQRTNRSLDGVSGGSSAIPLSSLWNQASPSLGSGSMGESPGVPTTTSMLGVSAKATLVSGAEAASTTTTTTTATITTRQAVTSVDALRGGPKGSPASFDVLDMTGRSNDMATSGPASPPTQSRRQRLRQQRAAEKSMHREGKKRHRDQHAIEPPLDGLDVGLVFPLPRDVLNEVSKLAQQHCVQPSPLLTVTLREYQLHALRWMVLRERTMSQALADEVHQQSQLPQGWRELRTHDGKVYYVNDKGDTQWYRPVPTLSREQQLARSMSSFRGGILADDMGMGKTVEMIALIVTNAGGGASHGSPRSTPPASVASSTMSSCAAPGEVDVEQQQQPQPQPPSEPLPTDTDDVTMVDHGSTPGVQPSLLHPSNPFATLPSSSSTTMPSPFSTSSNVATSSSGVSGTVSLPRATLVVCPLSVVRQWKSEIHRHTQRGSMRVYVYHGVSRRKDPVFLSQHDVVITTYGTLATELPSNKRRKKTTQTKQPITHRSLPVTQRSHDDVASSAQQVLLAVPWLRVILDEAHTIKDRKTRLAKATFALKAERRWCVTGTPIQNSLNDLFSLLHFLKVEPYCQYSRWRRTFIQPIQAQRCSADEHVLSNLRSLLSTFVLRRTKTHVDASTNKRIVELPERRVEVDVLTFSEPERGFYRVLWQHATSRFSALLRAGEVLTNYVHVLELLLRLRQACVHPYLVHSARQDKDVNQSAIDTVLSQLELSSSDHRKQLNQDLGQWDRLDCPLCMSGMTRAVVTQCGHLFCGECLRANVAAQWEHNQSTPTPANATATQGQDMSSAPLVKGTCPVCERTVCLSTNVFDAPPLLTFQRHASGAESMHDGATLDAGHDVEPKGMDMGDNDEDANALPHGDIDKDLRLDDVPVTSKLFASAKVVALLRELRQQLQADPSVKSCVFSQWTVMLDVIELALEREGMVFERLDGNMSDSQRQAAIGRFRSEPQCRVFLISTKAGGLGLNLTIASRVFLMDPWWNPATEEQVIDRVHRIGQTRTVIVKRYIVKGTIEERIMALQQRKQDMVHDALAMYSQEEQRAQRMGDLDLLFASGDERF